MPGPLAGAPEVAAALPAVFAARTRQAFERLLADNVRWGGEDDTEQTCHNREQAGDTYAALLAGSAQLAVLSTVVDGDEVLARVHVRGPDQDYETRVLITVRDGLVVDLLQLDDDGEPPAGGG